MGSCPDTDIDPNTFEIILHILGQKLETQNSRFRNCLPPEKVLALGLIVWLMEINIQVFGRHLLL